jgi:hypothetical protein
LEEYSALHSKRYWDFKVVDTINDEYISTNEWET